ncbi:4-hydroxy-3-methylbut-2-enyl diphosphate reductase [Actinosynnema sp. NPDC050436]|uniref:4-hydroxy-3-methylbut-2-enyl diphosphate reductase n=1 Tax=Actinosynnema sp. NPDC050436 TaxID=3155659 RepID=UPI0033D6BB11
MEAELPDARVSQADISETAIGGLAPGDIVVATEIVFRRGDRVRCPAAPVLWHALRRRGLDARLTALDTRSSEEGEAAVLLTTGPFDEGCGVAVAVSDRHLSGLATAREVMRAAAAAGGRRRVLLASPRSFCAGVERAVEIVERVLARNGPPVYVRKQIVHNSHVVRELEQRGVVFVDEVDEIPVGAPVVFSAHGVSPAVRAASTARELEVVDATCPLVTKVHAEARRFAGRGDTLVLIGHPGHEETEGTMGQAPERTVLVQNVADVALLEVADPQRVSYLTQTTLAVDETEEVIRALRARFPALRGPRSDDICYATTNRQNALRAVVDQADVVLVVGSENSSNSQRLVELARRSGTSAHLIDDVAQIEWEWLSGAETVGLTAGASAPASLVDEVVAVLRGLGPVEVVEEPVAREDVGFALPRKVFAHER